MRVIRIGLVTMIACFALGGSAKVAHTKEAVPPASSLVRAQRGCGQFSYGNCPSKCARICVPSFCSFSRAGGWICTQDCNGPGSCTQPAMPVGNLDLRF